MSQENRSRARRIVKAVLRVCAALIAGGLAAYQGEAWGDAVHTVRFERPPVVVVWTDDPADALMGPRVEAGSPRDAGLVLTGSLTAPETIRSIHVASNGAFQIEASWRGGAAPPDARVTLAVADIGPAAQAPGPFEQSTPLADLGSGGIVYTANRRTALARGRIADQAVRFDLVVTGMELRPGDFRIIVHAR